MLSVRKYIVLVVVYFSLCCLVTLLTGSFYVLIDSLWHVLAGIARVVTGLAKGLVQWVTQCQTEFIATLSILQLFFWSFFCPGGIIRFSSRSNEKKMGLYWKIIWFVLLAVSIATVVYDLNNESCNPRAESAFLFAIGILFAIIVGLSCMTIYPVDDDTDVNDGDDNGDANDDDSNDDDNG